MSEEKKTAVKAVKVVKGVKVPTLSPRKIRIAALLAVMGPGMIAGLSDDDPAGITTYSQMGAKYGYRLLWVLVLSTLALILFQDLGARIGVVTRQGLIGLVRQKYGARSGVFSASSLILANIGTMTAEFAGIAAAGQLFGVSKYLSVPVAGMLVTFLVLRGSFGRVEKVFFILSVDNNDGRTAVIGEFFNYLIECGIDVNRCWKWRTREINQCRT